MPRFIFFSIQIRETERAQNFARGANWTRDGNWLVFNPLFGNSSTMGPLFPAQEMDPKIARKTFYDPSIGKLHACRFFQGYARGKTLRRHPFRQLRARRLWRADLGPLPPQQIRATILLFFRQLSPACHGKDRFPGFLTSGRRRKRLPVLPGPTGCGFPAMPRIAVPNPPCEMPSL